MLEKPEDYFQVPHSRANLEKPCTLDQLDLGAVGPEKAKIAYEILQWNSNASSKREQIYNLYYYGKEREPRLSMGAHVMEPMALMTIYPRTMCILDLFLLIRVINCNFLTLVFLLIKKEKWPIYILIQHFLLKQGKS